MKFDLTPEQARVIGVLLEKEITTPDQYPLSLNGLTTGCNQKSNRHPVMSLTESQVQNILDELRDKKLITEQSGFGSRVVKYKHRFCNTEFGDLKFTPQQLAIVCVLLLRGPQTPGELRTRTNRLAEFANVDEVESCLQQMQNFEPDSLLVKLEREPGKRESRYAQLFTGPVIEALASPSPLSSVAPVTSDSTSDQERIAKLEQQVSELQAQLNEMQSTLDDLLS